MQGTYLVVIGYHFPNRDIFNLGSGEREDCSYRATYRLLNLERGTSSLEYIRREHQVPLPPPENF